MPRVRLATQFRYRRAKERRAKGDYMAAICDGDEVLRVVHHRMHNLMAALADIRRAVDREDAGGSRDRPFARLVRAKADES